MVKKLVLDTSVIVEFIVSKAPFRLKVTRLFDEALKGTFELYINTVTLSEVFYVSSKIYELAGLEKFNVEALNFVEWLKTRAEIVDVNENLALEAGELKKKLHISLPDCYVIATAKTLNGIAVFKKVENEMKPVLKDLRKLNVSFLHELDI